MFIFNDKKICHGGWNSKLFKLFFFKLLFPPSFMVIASAGVFLRWQGEDRVASWTMLGTFRILGGFYDATCTIMFDIIVSKFCYCVVIRWHFYVTYSGEDESTENTSIKLAQVQCYDIRLIFRVRTINFSGKKLLNSIKRLLSYCECRRNRITTDYCNINALENIVAC